MQNVTAEGAVPTLHLNVTIFILLYHRDAHGLKKYFPRMREIYAMFTGRLCPSGGQLVFIILVQQPNCFHHVTFSVPTRDNLLFRGSQSCVIQRGSIKIFLMS